MIEEILRRLDYKNVTYINGFDVLDNMSYMSADEVHPNIYGVQRIADVLTDKIRTALKMSFSPHKSPRRFMGLSLCFKY